MCAEIKVGKLALNQGCKVCLWVWGRVCQFLINVTNVTQVKHYRQKKDLFLIHDLRCFCLQLDGSTVSES